MELEFFFRESAFEHHLTEADIRRAFETCRYMGQYKDRSGRYGIPALLGGGTQEPDRNN
jgi:hypothetical protein